MKKINKQTLSVILAASLVAGVTVTSINAAPWDSGNVNVVVTDGNGNPVTSAPSGDDSFVNFAGFKYSKNIELSCGGEFVEGKAFPSVTVDADAEYEIEYVGFEYNRKIYEPGDTLPTVEDGTIVNMEVELFLKPLENNTYFYFTWDEETSDGYTAVADSKVIFEGVEYDGVVDVDEESRDCQIMRVNIPIYLGVDADDIIEEVTIENIDVFTAGGKLDFSGTTAEGFKVIEVRYTADEEYPSFEDMEKALKTGDKVYLWLLIDGGDKYFHKGTKFEWNGVAPDEYWFFNGNEEVAELLFIYEIGAADWQYIYDIELVVPLPDIGTNPAGVDNVTTETEGLIIDSVQWTPAVNRFDEIRDYRVAVQISADEDYIIPDDLIENGTATVNGNYADIIRDIVGYEMEEVIVENAPNGVGNGNSIKLTPVYAYFVVYDFIPRVPFNGDFKLSADGDTHKNVYSLASEITFKTKAENTNGAEVSYKWFKCNENGIALSNACISNDSSLTFKGTDMKLLVKEYYLCVATCGGKSEGVIFSCTLMPRRTGMVKPNYTVSFTDVSTTEWYYTYVSEASSIGLINGRSETSFAPDDNMTYAEAVKLAVCMNIIYNGGDPSTDIANGKDVWYSTYVQYALDHGILENDISSIANNKITREEYVYIFYRALPDEAFEEINLVPGGSIPDVDAKTTLTDFKTTLDEGKTTLETAKTTLETAKTTLDGAKTTLTEIKTTLDLSKNILDAKTTLNVTKTTLETAKTTLEEAIKALEDSKTTLDGAKTTLETAKTTLDNGIVILVKTTLDGAKTTLDGAKTTLDDAKTTLEVIKTTLNEIDKALNEAAVKDKSDFKTTLVTAITALEDGKTTLDLGKTTLGGAKTTLETAKTTLDGAKTTLDAKTTNDGKTTLEGAKTTLDTAKTTLELAKTTLDDAKTTLTTVKTTLNTCKTTLDGAKTTLKTTKTTLETAKTTLENAVAVLEDAKTTLDLGKTTLDDAIVILVKTTLDDAKTTLTTVKTTLDEIDAALDAEAIRDPGAFKTTLDTAIAVLDEGKTTLGGAKTTLDLGKTTLDNAIVILVKTTDEGKTTLDLAKTTLDGAKTTLDGAKTTLDDAKTTLTTVKTTLDAGKTTLGGFKTTLDGAKTTLKTTKTTLELSIAALENSKTTLDNAIVILTKTTGEGKTTLDDAKTTLTTVKTTLEDLKTTLTTVKTTLNTLDFAIDKAIAEDEVLNNLFVYGIRDPGTFKTTLDTAIKDPDAFKTTLKTTLDTAIATIEEGKTTLGGAKTTLDSGKTTLDNAIVILVKTTDEGKTTLDGAKTTLTTAKTTLETAKTTLDDAKTTLSVLKTTLGNGKTTLDAKTTLKTVKTTLEGAKTTLEAAITSLEGAKTTLDDAIVILVKTTDEGKTTDAGKTTLDTAKTTLGGAKTTLSELKTTLTQIKTTLDTIDSALNENAIRDPDKFKTTLDTVITVLEDGKTTLEGAKTTLDTGKTTLDDAIVILVKTTDEGKTTLNTEKSTSREDAVYTFYRAGILNGTDAKGTFNSAGNIKRSEVAAIVVRMMNPEQRVGAPAALNKTTMVNK